MRERRAITHTFPVRDEVAMLGETAFLKTLTSPKHLVRPRPAAASVACLDRLLRFDKRDRTEKAARRRSNGQADGRMEGWTDAEGRGREVRARPRPPAPGVATAVAQETKGGAERGGEEGNHFPQIECTLRRSPRNLRCRRRRQWKKFAKASIRAAFIRLLFLVHFPHLAFPLKKLATAVSRSAAADKVSVLQYFTPR